MGRELIANRVDLDKVNNFFEYWFKKIPIEKVSERAFEADPDPMWFLFILGVSAPEYYEWDAVVLEDVLTFDYVMGNSYGDVKKKIVIHVASDFKLRTELETLHNAHRANKAVRQILVGAYPEYKKGSFWIRTYRRELTTELSDGLPRIALERVIPQEICLGK